MISFLKNRISGKKSHEIDIDIMIKNQKEKMRASYGSSRLFKEELSSEKNEERQENSAEKIKSPSKEMQQIYKETQWGGGEFLKEIQNEITKMYSYTLAESKINAFILLCEKKNYMQYLTSDHRSSKIALKNFLVSLLIFFILKDEIREKKFAIIEKIAKKLGIPTKQLALALQIKLLTTISFKKEIPEDQIYSYSIIINQYSDETIKEACENIVRREANLWAKNTFQVFEELALTINYAAILNPLPKIKNNKDVDTALRILGISDEQNIDEVKRKFKTIALAQHPDKIISQKLPKILEIKSLENYNKIQEAYKIIINHNK